MNAREVWGIEDIPNEHFFFRRIHRNFIQNDPEFPRMQVVPQNVFNEPSKSWSKEKLANWKGISVDWDRFAKAEETLHRGDKEPSNYGVITSQISQVRSIIPLNIIHDPKQNDPKFDDNRAHSLITGFTIANKLEIRMTLAVECSWVLQGWG